MDTVCGSWIIRMAGILHMCNAAIRGASFILKYNSNQGISSVLVSYYRDNV